MGTYRYMGTWEMIDQVIVSGSLIVMQKMDYLPVQEMLRVFKPDFLLKKDPKYPGIKSVFNIPRIQVPGRLQRPSAGTA